MNIWILNHYAISPNSVGGTRHFDLAYELVKKGHTVRIFASSFNHLERVETIKYDRKKFKEESIDKVQFTWIKTPPYKTSSKRLVNISVFALRLNRVLNQYLKHETPDLIIGSSVHPLTPLVGIRKAKKAKVLFYFEERDLWPQTFIDFGILSERNIVSKVLFKIEKYLYTHSDKVIFLFENAHNYAYAHGLSPSKSIHIPNGYNTKRVNSSVTYDNIDEMLEKYKNKKICIYTGSMGEANHMFPLLELAESMKFHQEYHFLFVGSGNLKTSLIEFAKRNEITNISFHNPVPKEQIPYLLSKSHCGLLSMKDSPLYNWGFSMNKIYDYLSIGLPTYIYTGLESLGELEKSEAVFYSNEVEVLRKGIITGLDVERKDIKDFAYNNYSWDILANRLLKEIDK